MDKLQEMYNKQQALQERLGTWPTTSEKDNTQFIRDNVLYCIDELSEMMREIPLNKSWKNYDDFDRPNRLTAAQVEYIDALHFFLNIGLALGLDSATTHAIYMGKNKENHARQDEGYGFNDTVGKLLNLGTIKHGVIAVPSNICNTCIDKDNHNHCVEAGCKDRHYACYVAKEKR